MKRTTRLSLASLATTLLAASCELSLDGTSDIGQREEQVLTGNPDITFPNVVGMYITLPPDDDDNPQDPIYCTGTLIEECTVLTSARCVNENIDADDIAGIDLRVGAGFSEGQNFPIESIELHRYFDPDAVNGNELALIRLATPCPAATPVTLYDSPIVAADVGRDLTLVGYGITVDSQTEGGSRTKASTPVVTVGTRHVFAGTDEVTSCEGDSGGPGFFDVTGSPQLATMTVRQGGCNDTVQRTRLDLYTASFLYPYIDRFSGPCALDDVCVTDGCRTPDPDCAGNECQWGNECATGCETRDWDCEELGSFAGEACESSDDCEELGRCIPATDDESFTYCSRPCVVGDANACPTGMQCTDLGSTGECTWSEPSPGSQGADCVSNEQCRSNICENDICVFECGAGDSCPDPFTCGPSQVAPGTQVCLGEVFEGGGGFCSVGGDARNWLAPLCLALFGVPLITRRRRRRR